MDWKLDRLKIHPSIFIFLEHGESLHLHQCSGKQWILLWIKSVTFNFSKVQFLPYRVEVESTFKKHTSICSWTWIPISPICCPLPLPLLFAMHIWKQRVHTRSLPAGLYVLRDWREARRWGKELRTCGPLKFRWGKAVLWSKDASISFELRLCRAVNFTD